MGDFIVGVHVETVTVGTHCGAGLVDEVDHALGHAVKLSRGNTTVAGCVHNLVVGVARRHFKVEAGVQGGHAVVIGAPVGHDDALEAPLVA